MVVSVGGSITWTVSICLLLLLDLLAWVCLPLLLWLIYDIVGLVICLVIV